MKREFRNSQLIETYPPAEERKKLPYIRKTLLAMFAEIAKEFPSASITGQHISVKSPENEEQFSANAKFWAAVFEKLYATSESLQSLGVLAFWHQLPDEPAPLSHYTKREQFFKQHPRLAKLLHVAVAERTVPGEQVEIRSYEANLLFARPEQLKEGVVTFCLSRQEHERIKKPGLVGNVIMLPIKHPHVVFVSAGAISTIMLP